MIAAENVALNRGVDNFIGQPFGYQKIIDTPTRICQPRLAKVAPPSIRARQVRIAATENIDETRVQQFGKFLAFLIAEARAVMIGRGIF